MTAPALRLVAAIRAGAVLAHRPTSNVMHLYMGPLTPSGRWVPRAGRTACKAHTRRLVIVQQLLEPGPSSGLDDVLVGGRRVCRRCTAATYYPGELDTLNDRDAVATAYADLTTEDLGLAGRWARSTDESHQVGRVATILFGEKPTTPPARRTPEQAARAAMYDAIYGRRRLLEAAERSPEEQAKRDHMAEARRDLEQRVAAKRSNDAQRNRAIDRRSRNQYLTPHERELLDVI